MKLTLSFVAISCLFHDTLAFSSPISKYQSNKIHSPSFLSKTIPTTTSLQMSDGGGIERLEFKIFADGRIEETVKGIRGDNCQKVTEDINAALGEVVSTRPTEEMYEQELKISNTVEVNDGNTDGGWSGTDSSW